MEKTTNYSMFTFRKDNREQVNDKHVARLMESIKTKNLLEYRPIIVNSKMEILDGQHRLLAAQRLNVDIYFIVKKDSSAQDVLLLNNAKAWESADYLNFWVHQGKEDYIHLKQFIEESGVSLSIALNMNGRSRNYSKAFRQGDYKHKKETSGVIFPKIKQIVSKIIDHKGHLPCLNASRFWNACSSFISRKDVDFDILLDKIDLHIEKIGPRPSQQDYYSMLLTIYNWRSRNPIERQEKQTNADADENEQETQMNFGFSQGTDKNARD